MEFVKPTPTFHIYADDSVAADRLAVYGLIGTRVELRDSCAEILASAKSVCGIAPHSRLHCKVMYAGDGRRNSPFAGLTSSDVDDLYTSIAANLAKSIKPLVSIGFVRLPNMPRRMTVGRLGPEVGLVIDMPIEKHREKQALAFAFSAALAPFANHLHIPKERCLVLLGADATKIQWLLSRTRAHKAASSWAHGFPIRVEKLDPLLELADMVAYFGGHLLAATEKRDQAKQVLDKLQPRIWECCLTPEGWNMPALNHPSNRRFVARIDDVTDHVLV